MTKKDRIYGFLSSLTEIETSYGKCLFDFVCSILWDEIDSFLGITVIQKTDFLETGRYYELSNLTVKKFREKYFDSENNMLSLDTIEELESIESPKSFPFHYKVGDDVYVYEGGAFKNVTGSIGTYLRQYIKAFLSSNCFTVDIKLESIKGFDRHDTLMKIEDDAIVFIQSSSWRWYLFKRCLNLEDFIDYLDAKGLINQLFLKLFSSVEKDKQSGDVFIETDSVKPKIEKLGEEFALRYSDKNLSTSLSAYLMSWFDIGYNSSIVCLPIGKRLYTVSKYIERNFPTEMPSREDYTNFNGKNFNIADSSYVVKGEKISKNIQYGSAYNIIEVDGNMSAGFADKTDYYGGKWENTSPNKDTFGTKESDTAAYYGYVKPSNPLQEKDDGAPLGSYGNEYFIPSGDNNAAINTFIFHAMSSESGKQYEKFLEFLSSSYYNASPLSTMDGHPVSSYIEDVYDILFPQQ